jgi:ElaB/YqjD/DUF883 family membrane-anchored ribosome-binding protein
MSFSTEAQEKMDSTQAQITRLREQLEALMKDRVTPVVADLAGRAEHAYGASRDAVQHQAEAVSSQVRQRPLAAILVAAAIGWVIGRTIR